MARQVSVLSAVRRDLAVIRRTDAELAKSGLAAAALSIAATMDDPKTTASSKAQCARALRETLDRLRDLAPHDAPMDSLDDLARRRDARRADAHTA